MDDLKGGSGDDEIYGDGRVFAEYAGDALLSGGDDQLDGNSGMDILWGDGSAIAYGDALARLTGGADLLNGGRDANS